MKAAYRKYLWDELRQGRVTHSRIKSNTYSGSRNRVDNGTYLVNIDIAVEVAW
jgi:hypothetical protein